MASHAPSDDNYASILWNLPEGQRESAVQRMRNANAKGWKMIQLWSWINGRFHEADLVGIHPKTKRFEFLDYERPKDNA